MLNPAIERAFNEQINQEFKAAYLYLSMSAHFETKGLRGFAHWMRFQSQEEVTHGMKLFDYLHDRNGYAVLQTIDAPPSKFGAPIEIAENALQHEQNVTQLINTLYETAAREHDYVTAAQLQWFLIQQVEEEKTATDIVQRLTLAGDDVNVLLQLDHELGQRRKAGI